MPIEQNQQTISRPGPWETNQLPNDHYTLQLYQANSNFSDYIIAMNQHLAPKQNSNSKKKVKRQTINLTVDIDPHCIFSKPESLKSMKSPCIFKRKNKEEGHHKKGGRLIRMQSCYPKLGTAKRMNLPTKLHPLSPVRECERRANHQDILKSNSEKAKKFEALKAQEISKYNINEQFLQAAFYHPSKNTTKKLEFKHNRTFSPQSCHQSGGKKPSGKQSQFTDVSFWKNKMYKQPNFGNEGGIKVKQMVQYKDKWSINLLKKVALTNKQINSKNAQQQGKTLLI